MCPDAARQNVKLFTIPGLNHYPKAEVVAAKLKFPGCAYLFSRKPCNLPPGHVCRIAQAGQIVSPKIK